MNRTSLAKVQLRKLFPSVCFPFFYAQKINIDTIIVSIFAKMNCKRRVAIGDMLFVAKKVKCVAHLFWGHCVRFFEK